jgi:alanyl-tRNA synthetase
MLKVIGDHTRAVVYLISDGVYASNIGRGYQVRRLLRRVVRMGRMLGIGREGLDAYEGAFTPAVAEVVVSMSGAVDPDVKRNANRIFDELKREELRFVQTLELGERMLEKLLSASGENGGLLSGKDVFTLYDTFGFPVEITEEVAAERGVGVDLEGFRREMEGQRKMSQAANVAVKLVAGGVSAELAEKVAATQFLGYTHLDGMGRVAALVVEGSLVTEATEGQEVEVVLDKTPFYAESGGQVGGGLVL